MSRWELCGDKEGLKTSPLREIGARSEWLYTQQRFENDGEGIDAYIQLFRNEVAIRVVEKLLGFIAKSCGVAGKNERSTVWLAHADARVCNVVRYFTRRKIRRDRRQKLYTDMQGSMLELATEHLTGNVRTFVKY